MSIFKLMILSVCLSVPMLVNATTLSFASNAGNNTGDGFNNPINPGTTSLAHVLGLGNGFFIDSFALSVGEGESASIKFDEVWFPGVLEITDLYGAKISPTFKAGLSFSGLKKGDYGFLITGTNSGGLGGAYSILTSVSAVPVPAAVWFMGSAMIGLFSFRKRKAALAA
ncbi:MAG: hypothetical protein ABL903_07685 [Methylococcales bacterium]